MKEFIDLLFNEISTLIWILSGTLIVSFIVQRIYDFGVFARLPMFKGSKDNVAPDGVSVIICAKNEAENLRKNLPAFLQQNFPNYEVVVVNDASTDDTEEVLAEIKSRFPALRFTNIPADQKFTHGKKLAVTIGVKSAKYEFLLFSDADCYPATDEWISRMSSKFDQETEIVLGIGKYERRRGMLNAIIRYETLFTAMQYISLAIKKKAYMGVGRNMAYKKSLFFKNKGFASHLKVLSGDDDLFVNEAATKTNTRVELSSESFTLSSPPQKTGEWLKQKKRHLSTGKYYKASSKIRLGMEYSSRMLFYTTFIWMMTIDNWRWIALGFYILHIISRLIIMKLTMKRLEERDLLLTSLLLDLALPLILAGLRIANMIRPREAKWM